MSTLTIYKASAGSGKTFTLTVRYIWLMIRSSAEDVYMHTLAVTFTNKATAEMKDRIIEHLYGISHSVASSDDCLKNVEELLHDNHEDLPRDVIRERCRLALSHILHDYSRFRVETIDSFFQSVLRSLARELGLGANLQVDLNNREVVDHAVDRLIDALDTDGRLKRIVLSYAGEMIEESGRWNISQNLKDFAECVFGEDFQGRKEDELALLNDDNGVEGFRRLMRQTETDAKEALEKLCNDTVEAMDRAIVTRTNLRYTTPYGVVEKARKGVIEALSESMQKFVKGDAAVLLTKANAQDADVLGKAEAMCPVFRNFLDKYPDLIKRANTAQMARKYTHQLQLLGSVWDEILDLNEEMESINLASTPTLLSRLVRNEDSPFVFEKIGTVLENIMIDEFQDTSQQQWENFKVLLFENQSQGGHDLIVGDIKQSIYRWRGGDWNLLQGLGQSMSAWSPDIIPLKRNWRSQRRIIEFNNAFFPLAAKALDSLDPKQVGTDNDDKPIYMIDSIYGDVDQIARDNLEMAGYVKLTLRKAAAKSGAEEKQELLSWRMEEMLSAIRSLHDDGLPYEQMAILVRHRKEGEMILQYITENTDGDIPVSSDEAYRLDSSTLVMTVVSAIRVLLTDEKENPVPGRTFLMYWYRSVLKDNDITDERLLSAPTGELMPECLMDNRERLLKLSLYEMVEELYRLLGLDRIENQEAYHFAFMDAINDFLKDNLNDPQTFLEAWDDSICSQFIPSGKSDGIRILTIHKSKGLEFHTVLIPFADWAIENDNGKDMLWCEAGDGHGEFDSLGKMPIKKTSRMNSSYYSERYRREHLESRIDELNALYVAMTRPTCNLMMWGTCSVNPKKPRMDELKSVGGLLNYCLNPKEEFDGDIFCTSQGEPLLTVKKEKRSDNRMNPDREALGIHMQTFAARLNFRQSNEAQEMLEGMTQRQEGIIFHNIMSQIGTAEDIGPVIARARMQGILDDEMTERLEASLEQIRSNELIASWFAKENTLFNECDILDPKARRRDKRDQRPDRIVMHGSRIEVVDYKFGEEHDSYKGQVRNYMFLLRRLYPHHYVTGYLWYVNSEKIEEVSL